MVVVVMAKEYEYYCTKGACVVSKLVREIQRELGITLTGDKDGYIIYVPPNLKVVTFIELSPEDETDLRNIVNAHKPVVYRYLAYIPVTKRKFTPFSMEEVEVTTRTEVEVLEFDAPQDMKKLANKLNKTVAVHRIDPK